MSEGVWGGDFFPSEHEPDPGPGAVRAAIDVIELRQKNGLEAVRHGLLFGGSTEVPIEELEDLSPMLGLMAREENVSQAEVSLVADPQPSKGLMQWGRAVPQPPLKLVINRAYNHPLVLIRTDGLFVDTGTSIDAASANEQELIMNWLESINEANEGELAIRQAYNRTRKRRYARIAAILFVSASMGFHIANEPAEEIQPDATGQEEGQKIPPIEITAPPLVRGETVLETATSANDDIRLEPALGVDCDQSYLAQPAYHDPLFNEVRLPRDLREMHDLIMPAQPRPTTFFVADESRPPEGDGVWSRSGLALQHRPFNNEAYALYSWKSRFSKNQGLFGVLPVLSRVEAVGDQIATLSVADLTKGAVIKKGSMTVTITFAPMGQNGTPLHIAASCSER